MPKRNLRIISGNRQTGKPITYWVGSRPDFRIFSEFLQLEDALVRILRCIYVGKPGWDITSWIMDQDILQGALMICPVFKFPIAFILLDLNSVSALFYKIWNRTKTDF